MMVGAVIEEVGGGIRVIVEDIGHLIYRGQLRCRLSKCCDSLLIRGSGRTCNKDMEAEGDTLGG